MTRAEIVATLRDCASDSNCLPGERARLEAAAAIVERWGDARHVAEFIAMWFPGLEDGVEWGTPAEKRETSPLVHAARRVLEVDVE